MKLLDIPFLRDLVAIRHDIHAHPELAYHEVRTSELVVRELAAYGLEVHRGLAKTGVVGVLRKGSSKRSIGLRADMDALPLHEKNDFKHSSARHGYMHACGHDGHTTMLLGAARYLAENRERLDFDGTVHFVFQPAEESEGGAKLMISDGLFTKFPMDSVYGMHNWPGIPVGEMAVSAGPVMAGTCAFEIVVNGHGCHAAMPNLGVDTMVVACQLVLALQTVVSRNIHPCEAAVVSVTQIHGGDAINIIPDDAVLRGTIRSFKPEVQEVVERSIERLCAGIASAFGAQIMLFSITVIRRPSITRSKPNSACVQQKRCAGNAGCAATNCRRWARRISPTCCARNPAVMSGSVTAPARAVVRCTTRITTSTMRVCRLV